MLRSRVVCHDCALLHSLLFPGSDGEGGWWWSLLPAMRTGLIPSSLLLSVDKPAILVSQKKVDSWSPKPHPSWWCNWFLCSSLNPDSFMSLATEKFAEATPNPNEKSCANQVVQRTLTDKTAKQSVLPGMSCVRQKSSALWSFSSGLYFRISAVLSVPYCTNYHKYKALGRADPLIPSSELGCWETHGHHIFSSSFLLHCQKLL